MSFSINGNNSILVNNSTENQEKIISPNIDNNSNPNNSLWFNVPSPKFTPTAVVIKRNQMSLRSISTYNFQTNKDQLSSGAPFPSIPTRQEVQSIKGELENDIQRLRADLTSLIYERGVYNHSSRPLIPDSSSNGIHEYKGIVITDQIIDSIINENRQKSEESEKENFLDSINFKSSQNHSLPRFNHLIDLPLFQESIKTHEEILTPLFSIEYGEKDLIYEKENELAEEYHQYNEQWEQQKLFIDEYNQRTDHKFEEWPPEFNFDRPNIEKKPTIDTPMILTLKDKKNKIYYDNNNLIQDPIQSFNDFKSRVTWTEEEKVIFLEKYRQYPKEFSKITESLPEKSIKDVIEFYYLNRYHMSLKDETAAKRRTGKKIVYTEGPLKKHY